MKLPTTRAHATSAFRLQDGRGLRTVRHAEMAGRGARIRLFKA
jgi:hypothetical protein